MLAWERTTVAACRNQEARAQKSGGLRLGGLCGLVLANTVPALGPGDVVDDPLPGSVVEHIYATGLYR